MLAVFYKLFLVPRIDGLSLAFSDILTRIQLKF